MKRRNHFFSKVKLSSVKDIYWVLSCDCDCSGDMMSLNIIRWEEGKKTEILLAISNI